MSSAISPPACASSYLSQLGDVLERRGIRQDTWLQDSGVLAATLNDPRAFLSLDEVRALVKNALWLSKDPSLGLYLGQQLNLNAHGMLGYAGLVSSTIEDSLQVGFKYVQTRAPLLGLQLVKTKSSAIIEVCFYATLDEDVALFAIEAVLYSFATMARFLLGDHLPAATIKTMLPKPKHSELYSVFYPAPLTLCFDHKMHCLEFAVDVLSHPLPMSDRHARQISEEQIVKHLTASPRGPAYPPGSLAEEIHQLLCKMPGYYPDFEHVANLRNSTTRTLHRKLAGEGTSFQLLLENIQRRDAMHYVSSTGLTMTQISHLLGYTDSSNFSRAFRRWTGMSPSEFRRSQ